MKTLLSSPFCLINTVLVCLITSPISDSNVIYKRRQNKHRFIHTYTCLSSATWKTILVVKDFFLSHINQQIPWHEISVFEKKSMMWLTRCVRLNWKNCVFLSHFHCRLWKRELTFSFFNLIWRQTSLMTYLFYCTIRCNS